MPSPLPVSQPTTPKPPSLSTQPSAPTPPADPFASLVSSTPRKSSPLQQQLQSSHAPKSSQSSLLDLVNTSSPQPQGSAQAAGDDDWTFTSALPQTTTPSFGKTQILGSPIRIDFLSQRKPGENKIHVVATFSNTTDLPVSELHFQVAIEKVCTISYLCPLVSLFVCFIELRLQLCTDNGVRRIRYSLLHNPAGI